MAENVIVSPAGAVFGTLICAWICAAAEWFAGRIRSQLVLVGLPVQLPAMNTGWPNAGVFASGVSVVAILTSPGEVDHTEIRYRTVPPGGTVVVDAVTVTAGLAGAPVPMGVRAGLVGEGETLGEEAAGLPVALAVGTDDLTAFGLGDTAGLDGTAGLDDTAGLDGPPPGSTPPRTRRHCRTRRHHRAGRHCRARGHCRAGRSGRQRRRRSRWCGGHDNAGHAAGDDEEADGHAQREWSRVRRSHGDTLSMCAETAGIVLYGCSLALGARIAVGRCLTPGSREHEFPGRRGMPPRPFTRTGTRLWGV